MEGVVSITIDYNKFKDDAKWDGLKRYITNTKLSGQQIIYSYNNLWKIERVFRISKTDLKIRPIYHRLKQRIEAHICISVIACVLYKHLERILSISTDISMKKAIDKINKMYEIIIAIPGSRTQTVRL